jgi:hypothetical protein
MGADVTAPDQHYFFLNAQSGCGVGGTLRSMAGVCQAGSRISVTMRGIKKSCAQWAFSSLPWKPQTCRPCTSRPEVWRNGSALGGSGASESPSSRKRSVAVVVVEGKVYGSTLL